MMKLMISEHTPITKADAWRILQPWISLVHSGSASWTCLQRGCPDAGGEQGTTQRREGMTPLSVSQGFHAVCIDKRLFLVVALTRGPKDVHH